MAREPGLDRGRPDGPRDRPEARPLPRDGVGDPQGSFRGREKALLKSKINGSRVVEVHGAESWSMMPNRPRRPLQSVPGWFKLALVTVAYLKALESRWRPKLILQEKPKAAIFVQLSIRSRQCRHLLQCLGTWLGTVRMPESRPFCGGSLLGWT